MATRKKLDILVAAYAALAVLYLAGALFCGSVGLLEWFAIVNPDNTPEKRADGLLGGAVLGIPLAVAGIAHVVLAVAVARRRPWARMAGLIVGLLDVVLCCNPLGSLVGVYSLFALLGSESIQGPATDYRDPS